MMSYMSLRVLLRRYREPVSCMSHDLLQLSDGVIHFVYCKRSMIHMVLFVRSAHIVCTNAGGMAHDWPGVDTVC